MEAGGNGFVAAFVGGMAFGAARQAAGDVLGFASEAGELLAIVVWFTFGAIAVPVLDGAPWSVAVFAALALTVGRMIPVAIALAGTGLALAGTGLSQPTVAFLGWFGPRGLASIVFALIAYDELDPGQARTTMLAAIAAIAAIAATVLLSVIAHALTAKPLAGRYAACTEHTRHPADLRPTPEPPTRSRPGQRHEPTTTNNPHDDTSSVTLETGT